MYMTLFGASNTVDGVRYEVVERWFKECEIIDEKSVTNTLFSTSYERVNPNKHALSLVQFVELLGILSRETNQDVNSFRRRFQAVAPKIIEEIQASFN